MTGSRKSMVNSLGHMNVRSNSKTKRLKKSTRHLDLTMNTGFRKVVEDLDPTLSLKEIQIDLLKFKILPSMMV